MQDFIQTTLLASVEPNAGRVEEIFAGMTVRARRFIAEAGYPPEAIRVERSLDMRYLGQEHTVRVPLSGELDGLTGANDRFHQLHERAYTFRLDSAVEIVNFHVVATVPTRKPELTAFVASGGDGRPKGRRVVDYDEDGHLESDIYERSRLRSGEPIPGPAIIEEPAATTVVYPGMSARMDEIGNILIETGVG